MENINLKINGLEVSAPAGSTILEAAHLAGIRIPTLCYLKEINEIGACRMCVVEVKGAKNLVAACVYPINEGMEVWTNTPRLIKSRRRTLQLLLSTTTKNVSPACAAATANCSSSAVSTAWTMKIISRESPTTTSWTPPRPT